VSKVPFASRPDKWVMDNMAKDWPSVAQYIAYLEDLDRVTSERARIAELRLKQKACLHGFVHNGRCVGCGKEVVP
jgi:hypothetical protein